VAGPKIELVWDAKNELGEGPLWDPEDQLLYWIDSKGPTVSRYDPRNASVRSWAVPADIGSMALREQGGAIVALRNGIYA
jgi:L-arabinonolactonase